MAFYQITLFYPNAKSQQKEIAAMRDEIKSIAKANFRILAPGEQLCAIGFVSDLSREQLFERFSGLGSETFCFLLVEVSDVITGWFSQDTWRWLSAHAPSKQIFRPPGRR